MSCGSEFGDRDNFLDESLSTQCDDDISPRKSLVSIKDVIKKRLIIDGDGTGDDRRINIVYKKYIKWTLSQEANDSKQLKEQILLLIGQCRYAFMKSRIVTQMSCLEQQNYKAMSEEIEKETERAKTEIIGTKEEFKDAKIVKRNRQEYQVLAKVICQQPDRMEMNKKLVALRQELKTLEEKRAELEAKLEMRSKQLLVLVCSLEQLQAFLDEESAEKIDLTNDSDKDMVVD